MWEASESTDSINNMTQAAREKLKLKSLNWKGCDRFGNVYDSVDWELAKICMQAVDLTYQAQTS